MFLFRLALQLGYPHPDFLLQQLDSRQLSDWLAFYAIEPFGDERADLRMAINTSMLANINRDANVRKQPFTELDFMPFVPKQIKQKIDHKQQSRMIREALLGRGVRKK
jgi:hypothetical protein